MILLRDYQQAVIAETRRKLRTCRRVLIQLPTGAGKTVIAAFIIKSVQQRNMTSMFLCHRDFLVDQTSKTFASAGIHHSFIAAGRWFNRDADCHVAMVQTLRSRLSKVRPPDVVIWDEAHHIGAATWAAIMDAWPDALHVGLSATPARLDGKGLDKWFGDMVLGPSVRSLIERGHLSDYRAYAPSTPDLRGVHTLGGDYKNNELSDIMDRNVLIGDTVQHYKRLASGKIGLYFCTSIKHSQNMAAAFTQAGIPARHLDGTSSTEERSEAAQMIARRELMLLMNVELFGEGCDLAAQSGFDVTFEMLGMARPSQSLAMVKQQIGRALRPAVGKIAIILDHAGNIARHGLPDDDVEWSLAGTGRSKTGAASTVRQCENCFASIPITARTCRYCGHVKQADPNGGREIEQEDGELVEIDKDAVRKARSMEEWKCKTLEDWIALGKARGYADGWARRRHELAAPKRAARAHAEQAAMRFYEGTA